MKTRYRHYFDGSQPGIKPVDMEVACDQWVHIHTVLVEAKDAGQIKMHGGFDSLEVALPAVRSATVCQIVNDDGLVQATGYAFCSIKDQFCRRTGRLLAEERAQKMLTEKVV